MRTTQMICRMNYHNNNNIIIILIHLSSLTAYYISCRPTPVKCIYVYKKDKIRLPQTRHAAALPPVYRNRRRRAAHKLLSAVANRNRYRYML
jgi:hypothetical protein